MGNQQPCIFCNIVTNEKEKLLYEDDQIFVIRDINQASSQTHILICPKQCIKNVNYLTKDHIQIVQKMKQVGESILEKEKPGYQKRFGFHQPPFNTINHLHLHGFNLPIENFWYNKVIYNLPFIQVEELIAKL